MLLTGRLTQCFWVGEIKQNHKNLHWRQRLCRPTNQSAFPKIMRKWSHHLSKSLQTFRELLILIMWNVVLTQMEFFLEFYKWLNDFEPFYVQYDSPVNILVRIRAGSESNENECGFCKELYHEGKTWLQCPSCRIWFHKECFGK